MVAVPFGISLWLSALAIRFRDVKFVMPFVIRMLMFTAPIVYTASSIPAEWRFAYSLNPLVGVIEGMRSTLLGTELEWIYIMPGIVITGLLVYSGLLYFKRMERIFADVI
jgi:lipopolysaccharide transport system permease protein